MGVELVGVGLPAHFLVGTDDGAQFYDPFHSARTIDREGVRQLFTQVTGGRMSWRDTYLAPTPPRHIVIRMLNNLRATFAERDDAVRLAIVMELRAVIPEVAAREDAEIRAATAVFN